MHGKALNGKTVTAGITNRPAFRDIANESKKPGTLGGPVKPNVTRTTKTTTVTAQVSQRDAKKTVVTTTKPDVQRKVVCGVKREESIVKQSSVVTKSTSEAAAFKEPKALVKSYSTQCLDVVEENKEGDDPQFVAEYINDIFAYLRSLESKFTINELFLVSHRTTSRMRSVLINWLIEVHSNFRLLPETLHLCVSVVDRYLQKNKSVGRENLQLVGISALLVAAKYEEMYIPDLSDFVYVCDETFTKEEIMRMELSIIKALDYSFGRPLSLHFLRRYSKVGKVQPQHHTLAKYLLELALIELDLCHIRPSLQAAAACCLSLSVFNDNKSTHPAKNWTRTLIHYSTYTYSDLEKPMKLLATAVVKAETSKYQAIRNKYSSSSNGKISLSSELKGPVIQKLTQK